MNLQNYLKHAPDCLLKVKNNDRICLRCGYKSGQHYSPENIQRCPIPANGDNFNRDMLAVYDPKACSCGLSSIQSRLVLLPDGLKEKIVEVMKRYESDFTYKGDWFNAVHSDNFNTVAEDIVKAVKGGRINN